MLARAVSPIVIAVLVAACGPVPGGELEGKLTPTPTDWTAALEEGHAFCEVESRPADPHSIQLDCFLDEGRLYVQSHRWVFASWWPVESWAAIWIEHPEIRVRIGSGIYELRAVHVTDEAERGPILLSRGYDPIPAGIAVFRFDDRG